MNNVVSLEQKRIEQGPHVTGQAICMHCRHKWAAVRPLTDDAEDMQCPACGLPRGVWEYNFTVPEGPIWTCAYCPSQAFKLTPVAAYCIGCGRRTTYATLAEATP